MGGSLLISKQREKNLIICLAYFVRYGYLALMVIVLYILSKMQLNPKTLVYVFSGGITLDGIYHFIGLRFRFKHLYCAMENAYHKKMTPNNSGNYTKEMKRDIIFIGCFFTIMGIILIILNYRCH